MQKLKRIILPLQGHSKTGLHWLYNTRTDDEPPLIFEYEQLKFTFSGTGFRNVEKLRLHIEIPEELLGTEEKLNVSAGQELSEDRDIQEERGISEEREVSKNPEGVAVETYLLGVFAPMLKELCESYENTNKDCREKASFEAQEAGHIMVRRSGIHYDVNNGCYVLSLNFSVPLVNALSVNAKSMFRAVKDILFHVNETLQNLDTEELFKYVTTYRYQWEIRAYMEENNLCAFVANGSILPRENGTDEPMTGAIPFTSPKELYVEIPLSDGTTMSGMGIPCGVTVITGGGYSGKSTLLDAIEVGIYNHIPGDGREFVLASETALKTDAEDGRPVNELNIAPFFYHLPGKDLEHFSTLHASGSVSQAANIIEAVCGESKLLLIDEDKSATNFIIRDDNMRLVVKNEPIIPFTDRVRELYREKQVSTILVIGGSSEYLSYADHVILMEEYVPQDITEKVKELPLSPRKEAETIAEWTVSRRLIPKETNAPFLFVRHVETENEKKIILDDYSADITHLTAVISGNQMNTLASLCEQALCDKGAEKEELLVLAERYTQGVFGGKKTFSFISETEQRFYEELRPLDLYCCLNRMRGVRFTTKKTME